MWPEAVVEVEASSVEAVEAVVEVEVEADLIYILQLDMEPSEAWDLGQIDRFHDIQYYMSS